MKQYLCVFSEEKFSQEVVCHYSSQSYPYEIISKQINSHFFYSNNQKSESEKDEIRMHLLIRTLQNSISCLLSQSSSLSLSLSSSSQFSSSSIKKFHNNLF